MRTIVAGSRSITPQGTVWKILDAFDAWSFTEIITGGAAGADMAAVRWAELRKFNHRVFYPHYPAYQEDRKKLAPLHRNEAMAEEADALIAIWDGKSKGTEHMIQTAQKKGLKVRVVEVA